MKRLVALMVAASLAICVGCGKEAPKAKKSSGPMTPPPVAKGMTKAPEEKAPEAKAPEAKAPEAKAPEAKAPEAKAPEAKAPEAKAPEAKAPPAPPEKK